MGDSVEPCAYCGNPPTEERHRDDGTVWRNAGRLVCRAIGCPGQGERKPHSFGFVRKWNAQQRNYASQINKAKRARPPLFARTEPT